MRRLITIVASALAAIALPAVAGADATQTVDSWSNQPVEFYAGDGLCTGQTVAGNGIESGSARITETSDGGVHVRGQAQQTIPLYAATGPPWDVHFGAYVGTWSSSVNFDEQIAPGGHDSLGSVAGGRIVYADGSTRYAQILFRLVLPPDGPPKLFLVKFVCGGAA